MDQITTTLFIFLVLILWAISPIGILFFSASKTLFSKKSSAFKRKIAWIVQSVAFLTWASLMTIMLIIYLDSVSYNVFGVRSVILDFAIMSGFAFLFIMLLMCIIEKKTIANIKNEKARESSKERSINQEEDFKNNKKINEGVKIADAKTDSGIKAKIKRKLKEDLKEIVDEEIDKRL